MTSNIMSYGKTPTLREAKNAIELYRKREVRVSAVETREAYRPAIDAFERLAPTPPASLIVQEATKLLIAKPGIAAAAGEGFIPLLIEDLMMEIPDVSTMAILEGFHKLRMSTEPFKCTGEIIAEIRAADEDFKGARRHLYAATRVYNIPLSPAQIERRTKVEEHHQRELNRQNNEEPWWLEELAPSATLVAEGDTDGDCDY
jgi:hypothetical protein